MRAAGLLRAARERIAERDHWTQYDLAVDAEDQPVGPDDLDACRWCGLGALIWARETHHAGRSAYDAALWALRGGTLLGGESVVKENDYYPPEVAHPRVLALYDRAIARAEEAQG